MPFVFLIESASSTMDLYFKPAKESPSCLDGRSWRAGMTEVKEPGITSPIPSDTQQDKGECPGLRARLSLPQVTDCYVGNKHENLVTARKRLFSLSKESRHR